VDLDEGERIQQPSEITETEARNALTRACDVAEVASMLSDLEAQAMLANPPAGAVEVSARLFAAYLEAGEIKSPEATAAANGRTSGAPDKDDDVSGLHPAGDQGLADTPSRMRAPDVSRWVRQISVQRQASGQIEMLKECNYSDGTRWSAR
jgi:hypothetical protein